ncbi:MAG: twin-arginine translocation signal domain-containing protein [Cyclobacteriaceae bacterium]|nr:twin-arginine translocation signal domain-containing protein [Cyclobacteriaceae bacterium]
MKDQPTNRRDFLKKGLLAAAAATGAPLAAQASTSGETVKMLTPDGKLVEVDKAVLAKAPKKKVTNREILEWRKGPELDAGV